MTTMDYRDYENMDLAQLATIRSHALERVDLVTQALKKSVRREHEQTKDIKKLARKAGVTRRTIYAWLAE